MPLGPCALDRLCGGSFPRAFPVSRLAGAGGAWHSLPRGAAVPAPALLLLSSSRSLLSVGLRVRASLYKDTRHRRGVGRPQPRLTSSSQVTLRRPSFQIIRSCSRVLGTHESWGDVGQPRRHAWHGIADNIPGGWQHAIFLMIVT